MLHVIAHYRVEPGHGDDVARVLQRHATMSAAEPGCVEFTVYRSTDDPDVFALVEAYADEAAFAAHRQTPHFAANITETIVPVLAERSWRRYTTLL